MKDEEDDYFTRGWRYKFSSQASSGGYTCWDCVHCIIGGRSFCELHNKRVAGSGPNSYLCKEFTARSLIIQNVAGGNPEREYQGGPTRDML